MGQTAPKRFATVTEKICVVMGQVLLTPPSLKTFHNVHSLLNKTQIAPHGSTIRLTFPSVEPIPPHSSHTSLASITNECVSPNVSASAYELL